MAFWLRLLEFFLFTLLFKRWDLIFPGVELLETTLELPFDQKEAVERLCFCLLKNSGAGFGRGEDSYFHWLYNPRNWFPDESNLDPTSVFSHLDLIYE